MCFKWAQAGTGETFHTLLQGVNKTQKRTVLQKSVADYLCSQKRVKLQCSRLSIGFTRRASVDGRRELVLFPLLLEEHDEDIREAEVAVHIVHIEEDKLITTK